MPAIAAAAALASILGFMQLRARRGPLGGGGWFVIFIGWVYAAPTLLAKVTNSYAYSRDALGDVTVTVAGLPAQLAGFSGPLVGAASVLLVLRALRGKAVVRWSPVILAWLVIVYVGIATDVLVQQGRIGLLPVLLAVMLMALTVAGPTREQAAAGAAAFALSLLLAGAAVGLLRPELVAEECVTKCGLAGVIYSGATSHGNSLGLLLALSLPAVWFTFRGRPRAFILAVLIAILLLTGSRTSSVAGAATVLLLVITKPELEDGVITARMPKLLTAVALIAAAVSLAVPFLVTDDDFATGRGRLWRLVEENFTILGSGHTAWEKLYERGVFGEAAAYSTHNQWQEALLVAGVLGLLALALAVLASLLVGSPSRRLGAAVFIASVFALGVLERPLAFSAVSPTTWALVVLVAFTTDTRSVLRRRVPGKRLVHATMGR